MLCAGLSGVPFLFQRQELAVRCHVVGHRMGGTQHLYRRSPLHFQHQELGTRCDVVDHQMGRPKQPDRRSLGKLAPSFSSPHKGDRTMCPIETLL